MNRIKTEDNTAATKDTNSEARGRVTVTIINDEKIALEFYSVREKLLQAIEKLKAHRLAQRESLKDEEDTMARHIIASLPVRDVKLVRRAQRPREMVGEATSRREIEAVRKAAQNLADALHALHAPARAALGFRAGGAFQESSGIHLHLLSLIAHAENYQLEPIPPNAGLGRKSVPSDARFALELAKVYEFYTGRKATVSWNPTTEKRYGPFLDFVTDIFGACELTGSPISRAVEAAKTMQKIRPPKGQ
ncbi:hypothetical protein [Acidisoma sp. C75]